MKKPVSRRALFATVASGAAATGKIPAAIAEPAKAAPSFSPPEDSVIIIDEVQNADLGSLLHKMRGRHTQLVYKSMDLAKFRASQSSKLPQDPTQFLIVFRLLATSF